MIANALDVSIHPNFEWIRRLLCPLGVTFQFIRWAVHNIHAPAVGLPSRSAGCIMLVRICDTAVMFLFEVVLRGARNRIASLPELFDKLLPFFIAGQFLERRTLFIGDDISDVLIHPFHIRRGPRGSRTLLLWRRPR